MNIKEVSTKFSISADTLRYYEKVGLIPKVSRNASGNREYSKQDLSHIEFIKCMRQAGLGIDVLNHYVSLYLEGNHTVLQRKDILESQRELLIKKMQDMQETLDLLNQKIDRYEKGLVKTEL